MLEYTIEKDWSISHDEYSMNQYDHKSYHKIWSQTFKEKLIENSSPVLLINDADQIFYNSILQPTISTIVDPNAYLFTEIKFRKHLCTTPFLNVKDSLGFTRKLTLLDLTFQEALEDGCFKTKFDLIFLNVKNKDELSLLNIEKYFLLLNNFGFLCIQSSEDLYTQQSKSHLDHYFTELSDKARTSNCTSKVNYFITYRKITQLI